MIDKNQNRVEVVKKDTAQKFIQAMNPYFKPNDKLFWDPCFPQPYPRYWGNRWIYRGQWDSDWHLTPSAFRDNAFKKFGLEDQEDFIQSIGNELFCLLDFLDLANRCGLDCGYGPYLFDVISEYRDSFDKSNSDKSNRNGIDEYIKKFPDNRLLHCLSLAQHHGIPTRLLDFTYDPLHAAFFAAMDVLEEEKQPEDGKKLAVWAVHMADAAISHRVGTKNGRVINVPLSYAENHYMQHQRGVLLLDTEANQDKLNNGSWKGLDELDDGVDPFFKFKKITLPQSEADALIKDLSEKYFINPVSAMPTLDNVVKTMRTSMYNEDIGTSTEKSISI